MERFKTILHKFTTAAAVAALLGTSVFAGMGITGQKALADSPDDALNYVVVANPGVDVGGTQDIVVSVGDGETDLSSAALLYHRGEESCSIEASEVSGDAILFEETYTDPDEAGEYVLDAISYTASGAEYTISLADEGIDACYGVGAEVETQPDDYVLTDDAADDAEISAYSFNDEGEMEEQASIGDAIAGAQESSGTVSPLATVTVVLDPGHDATHTGATGNGLREENLTLKIAQYCKEELETYSGVTVYMTRSTAACSNGGGSTSACLTNRVNYAKNRGADVFVSIHINSGGGTGAEVYYPNSYGSSSIHSAGSALATQIEDQLVKLGLANRGTKTRDSSSGTDYYAVIRQSKNAGFPGIIIEHAFIDNSSDVSRFLGSDSGLKQLGVADATGIANYYGLSKDGGGSSVSDLGNTYYFKNSISAGDADIVVAYGQTTDEVMAGDWNGDGQDTLCVRRGNVYYFKNSISNGDADQVIAYGKADDEVLVGDWDGDGQDTLCVRRGNVYYFKNSISNGDADQVIAYGKADDAMLAGDWDGNGTDTLCARRGAVYYFKNSISDGSADQEVVYGRAADEVYMGDWDGNGTDTPAVRRGRVYYFINTIHAGNADQEVVYGREGDAVLAGDWDGNKTDTLCVRR